MKSKQTKLLVLAVLGLLFCFNSPILAQQPDKWEKEIAAFEQQDKQQAPPREGIVFTGSSTIRMWKNLEETFPNVPVLNRGFGGSQIEDITRHFDRLVKPYDPRQVVIYSGDNDIASGKTPERVAQDFQTLFNRIRKEFPRAQVLYIGIKPSLSRWAMWGDMEKANDLIRDFLAKHRRTTFLDIAPRMLGADGKPRPELFASDGLHLSPEGYAVWNEAVRPLLIKN